MKLVLSGHPTGLKIDKDDKTFITLELPVDGIDMQTILPFVKKECYIRVLSSKRDLNTKGYIDELTLKSKLKLKVRCTEDVNLNIVNQLIADPETTSIIFDDMQATLTDYAAEELAKKAVEVTGSAEGAKKLVETAKEIATGKAGGKTFEVEVQKFKV